LEAPCELFEVWVGVTAAGSTQMASLILSSRKPYPPTLYHPSDALPDEQKTLLSSSHVWSGKPNGQVFPCHFDNFFRHGLKLVDLQDLLYLH